MSTPEGRLYIQVFMRAALDWVRYRQHRDYGKKVLARKAYVWLFNEAPADFEPGLNRTMCFESICDKLGWEVTIVRDWLRTATLADLRQAQIS